MNSAPYSSSFILLKEGWKCGDWKEHQYCLGTRCGGS